MARNERWLTNEAQAVDGALGKVNQAEERQSREFRGDIAALRPLAGKMPDRNIRAATTAVRILVRNGLVPKDTHSYDSLTNGERAAVVALALAADGPRASHAPNGESFGYAFGQAALVAKTRTGNDNLAGVMRKITYDDDFSILIYDLHRAVRRLGDVKLDYAVLARDLTQIQNPDRKSKVIMRWVKDFYRAQGYDKPAVTEEEVEKTTSEEE